MGSPWQGKEKQQRFRHPGLPQFQGSFEPHPHPVRTGHSSRLFRYLLLNIFHSDPQTVLGLGLALPGIRDTTACLRGIVAGKG